MFDFLKTPCNDGDLFGYVVQGAGGAYNLVHTHKVGVFSKEKIIQLVNLSIQQRKKKIDTRQQRLVDFAAEIIGQQVSIGGHTEISKYIQQFASMMMAGGVNFRDPSIKQFKDQLDRYGCVFNI